ncbi:hypothetical protein RRSWK_02875 [Rhodopirellula sp. SWK7]|nr:hypothetical protein RRSWK_02875 [Rhodopirellula sp. SWK7]
MHAGSVYYVCAVLLWRSAVRKAVLRNARGPTAQAFAPLHRVGK